MVPKDVLKSGYFKYLEPNKKSETANSQTQSHGSIQQDLIRKGENNSCRFRKARTYTGHVLGNVVKPTVTGLSIAGRVADDVVRLIVPAGAATLRGISIAGIVTGAVLTPIFAAWSFYSTSKRMDEHLHLLCDDLIYISQYFTINLCDEYCKNARQPGSVAVEGNRSSSDDDSLTSDSDELDQSQ